MVQQFTKGDTVELKSGGPRMTVEDVLLGVGIRCQWFAGSKLQDGMFPPESLKKPEEEQSQDRKKQ